MELVSPQEDIEEKNGDEYPDLPEQQEAFVSAMMETGFDRKKSLALAGYKTMNNWSSQAYQLLRKPKVKKALAIRKAEISSRYDISRDGIMRELAAMGFSNIQDYIHTDHSGNAKIDFSTLSREQGKAIAGLDTTVRTDKEGNEVVQTRIKLADKISALEKLAKIAGFAGPDSQVNIQNNMLAVGGPELDVEAMGLLAGAFVQGQKADTEE